MSIKNLISPQDYAQYKEQIDAIPNEYLYTLEQLLMYGFTIKEALENNNDVFLAMTSTPICFESIMHIRDSFIHRDENYFIFLIMSTWGIEGYKAATILIDIYCKLINYNPSFNVFELGPRKLFTKLKNQNLPDSFLVVLFGKHQAPIVKKLINEIGK